MKYCYLSDVGLVRTTNEDTVYISKNRFGHVIALVADGMGGHNAGDIASKLAVTKLGKAWSTTNKIETIEAAKKWLSEQFKQVNQNILMYAEAEEVFSGMGTTLTVAIIINEHTIIANVGDSRGYVVHNNVLLQVTKDQSLVNELINQGEISQDEALFHPQKNVIMQAVGTSNILKIDFFELENQYEYLLLCSDGLSDMLSYHEIDEIVRGKDRVEDKIYKLVGLAKEYGGYDNISVALVEVGE